MYNEYKRLSVNTEGLFSAFVQSKRTSNMVPDYSKKLSPKQIEEVREKGLELLAKSNDRCYGYYRLSCGHETFLHYGAVRKAKTLDFKCTPCLDNKLKTEAEKIGLVYHSDVVVEYDRAASRYYTLACGHSKVVKTANVRSGVVGCDECMVEQHKCEAEQQGLKWTGIEDDRHRRLYILPCGHEKYIMLSSAREGAYRCRICQENKYEQDAINAGIEYLKGVKSSHHDYRVYKLACGCVKELTMKCVTENSFECKTHDKRTLEYSQPISVYLSEFKLPIGNVLKLGFAADVKGRHARYGLKGQSSLIYAIRFSEGEKAVALEKSLHSEYKQHVLDKELMRLYMVNGYTECYPLSLKDELLSRLQEAKERLIYNNIKEVV